MDERPEGVTTPCRGGRCDVDGWCDRHVDGTNEPECPGHYDDDFTLVSGAGVGEPTFCNGRCNY